MRETCRIERIFQTETLDEAVTLFHDGLPEGAQIQSIIWWEPQRAETTTLSDTVAAYIDAGYRVWAEVNIPVKVCETCGATT